MNFFEKERFMKYISQLSDKEFLDFVSSVLSSEYAVFNSLEPKFIDFGQYLQITSKEQDGVIVSSNYNCGLVPYNIFTLTDYEISSLYPLCQDEKDYSRAWQKRLTQKFPDYENDLNKYLSSKSSGKQGKK